MNKTIGLRVDVDTFRGTRDGVPALLALLQEHGIQASFFFSVGPDNMGRHLWRLLKPAFLLKMLRSNAPGLYGWDIVLRGTLGPGPLIGRKLAAVIQASDQAGHEIGLHAWDHHYWQTHLEAMSEAEIIADIQRGLDCLRTILGYTPDCSAVAGWRCNNAVLQAKERFPFRYNSDCRGTHVFHPVMDGSLYTPQIPVTLPTYDEVIGRDGVCDDHYNQQLLDRVKPGQLNVLTIHAEVEGIARLTLFRAFLQAAREQSVSLIPLGRLLDSTETVSLGQIENWPLSGREGRVAWQSDCCI